MKIKLLLLTVIITFASSVTAQIRFTQTKKHLYATTLSWPTDKQVVIKALALGSPYDFGKITRIELLGYGRVSFQRTSEGLVITPFKEQVNEIASMFKIKM